MNYHMNSILGYNMPLLASLVEPCNWYPDNLFRDFAKPISVPDMIYMLIYLSY